MTTALLVHLIREYGQGGSERRLEDMLAAGRDIGVDAMVVVAGSVDQQRAARGLSGVEVVELGLSTRDLSPVADLRTITRVRGLMTDRAPDLLVTHQSKGHLFGRVARLPAAKEPRVLSSLSMSPTAEANGGAYWRVLSSLSRRGDAAVAVGEEIAHEYEERTSQRQDPGVNVVRSGIDDRFFDAPLAVPPTGEELVLVHVGSMTDRKRPWILPDVAWSLRKRTDRPVRLRLAGDGPLLGDVVARCGRLSIPVDALGHVEDVLAVIDEADSLVLTSRSEGVPQVLVQAALRGVPFVTADVHGAREVLDRGASGLIVPADGEAMAAAVAVLVDRSERVRAALRGFEEWRPAVVRQQYARILRELLE